MSTSRRQFLRSALAGAAAAVAGPALARPSFALEDLKRDPLAFIRYAGLSPEQWQREYLCDWSWALERESDRVDAMRSGSRFGKPAGEFWFWQISPGGVMVSNQLREELHKRLVHVRPIVRFRQFNSVKFTQASDPEKFDIDIGRAEQQDGGFSDLVIAGSLSSA